MKEAIVIDPPNFDIKREWQEHYAWANEALARDQDNIAQRFVQIQAAVAARYATSTTWRGERFRDA